MDQDIVVMRGVTDTLEKHHAVRILDEAVEDAVRLSHLYLSGRQLPDKSVSVLDTACARVAIGLSAVPPAVEDSLRRITQLDVAASALEREAATGADHAERITELRASKAEEEQNHTQLKERWEKERKLVDRIREVRTQLEGQPKAQEIDGASTAGAGASTTHKAAAA